MSDTPSILSSKFKEQIGTMVKTKKIAILRQKLLDTDYIFIKLKEYEEVGAEKPYSDEYIAEKHAERQAIREQINALQ